MTRNLTMLDICMGLSRKEVIIMVKVSDGSWFGTARLAATVVRGS